MESGAPFFQAAGNATKRLQKTGYTMVNNLHVTNPNTVSLFMQIFDAAAAGDVTLGTTTPDYVLAIPDGTSATLVGAIDKDFPRGLRLGLGFVWAITTTNTGSTGPSSNCGVSGSYS